MFKIFFEMIINLMATLVQIVTYPLNLAITTFLPDLSDKIIQVTNGIPTLFSGFGWSLGLLPPGVLLVLLFIVSVEIAKHSIILSTQTLIKLWNLLGKLKIW